MNKLLVLVIAAIVIIGGVFAYKSLKHRSSMMNMTGNTTVNSSNDNQAAGDASFQEDNSDDLDTSLIPSN